MLELLLLFIGTNSVIEPTIDYCNANLEDKSLSQKIDMGIGCSTVNGRRVYDNYDLKEIYNRSNNE